MTETDYGPAFYEELAHGALESARVVVPRLLALCDPRSVVDVGCGQGIWLRAFAEHGVSDLVGVDGDYVRPLLDVPSERFVAADLRDPLELDRSFDLVLALEVAEHLPDASAEAFVSSLTRLAPAVVFSAAVPGQGGVGHLNERWPAYWAALFRQRGYLPLDVLRPSLWEDQRVDWWYAQNALLYLRSDRLGHVPSAGAWPLGPSGAPLSLIHPRMLAEAHRRPRGVVAGTKNELRHLAGRARSRLRGLRRDGDRRAGR